MTKYDVVELVSTQPVPDPFKRFVTPLKTIREHAGQPVPAEPLEHGVMVESQGMFYFIPYGQVERLVLRPRPVVPTIVTSDEVPPGVLYAVPASDAAAPVPEKAARKRVNGKFVKGS